MKYFEIVEFDTSFNRIVRLIDCSTGMDFVECGEYTFLIMDNMSGDVFECRPHAVHAVKVVPERWKSTNGLPDILRVVGCQFQMDKNILSTNSVIHVDVSGGDRVDVRNEFSIYQLSEPQCWYMKMENARRLGIAR